MGYEIEVKYRVSSLAATADKLAARGVRAEPTVEHRDAYLAHPSRDFAQTGEAFRIRSEGVLNRITYKGAKQEGPTKTREEIEVEFAEGSEARDQLARAFELMGFRPVALVKKIRREYHLEFQGLPMTVALDEADELGHFAEVETLAATEADLPEAQSAVLALAGELGLTEVEPRSYLRMLLEAQGRFLRNPAGQT